MNYDSHSPENTYEIAFEMGRNAQKGSVYCLYGDLGSGKTAFVKGFAAGLGIEQMIVSPTFTIVNEYYGDKLTFYHFDVYRINTVDELEETGYFEIIRSDAIAVIEWADLIQEVIPERAIGVYISKDLSKGEDYRRIEVKNVENISR